MKNPPSLFNTLPKQSTQAFFDDDFRNILEDHLPLFLFSVNSSVSNIDANVAYKWNGDFYGIANSLGIPWYMQWIAMRVNGFTDPSEYSMDIISIIIPDYNLIEQLLNSYIGMSSLV